MVSRAMLVFDNAIKSEATRKAYHYALEKFCEWAKISEPDGLLQLKTEFLQQIVEDYLFYLKKRLAVNSINPIISAIDLFLTLGDKELKIKKIRKMFPERTKLAGGAFWNNEEIRKMLEGESLRNKLIVHFLCASGVRVGALPDLRLEHISNMDFGCKKVIVYFSTKDEYVTFVNNECANLLQSYIDSRIADGENTQKSSPLFRADYNTVGISPVRPMSLNAIKLVLWRLGCKTRGKNSGKYVRYSHASAHSYRKRFITLCKQSDNANVSLVEKLAGHQGVVATDNSYFRPDVNRLFSEYVKHMNTLEIDDAHKVIQSQQEKIQTLENEKDRVIEKQAGDISELKNDIKILFEMMKKG
jgi:integrase